MSINDDDHDDIDDDPELSMIASVSVTKAPRTGDLRAIVSSSVDLITSSS